MLSHHHLQEYAVTTHLFILSLMFLTGVLKFSLYRYYASVVKFMDSYFYLLISFVQRLSGSSLGKFPHLGNGPDLPQNK